MTATRLSVTNYNTTLSSDSLETGTGSSNSLRSASPSVYPVSLRDWSCSRKMAHSRNCDPLAKDRTI
jgi:hypothetical protein